MEILKLPVNVECFSLALATMSRAAGCSKIDIENCLMGRLLVETTAIQKELRLLTRKVIRIDPQNKRFGQWHKQRDRLESMLFVLRQFIMVHISDKDFEDKINGYYEAVSSLILELRVIE